MECVVKPLRDVKVTGSKPARTKKNPTMLRVGVAQAGCNPWVPHKLTNKKNKNQTMSSNL